MEEIGGETTENVSSKEKKIRRRSETKTELKRLKKSSKKELKTENLLLNSIPIFTDVFLDLYRGQKSEIRSLKTQLNQLNERLKFRDAQQEQIRLDNQKMRRDIEEIHEKNLFFENQINQIEKYFRNLLGENFPTNLIEYLQQHQNNQQIENYIKDFVRTFQP